jgi:hypothetical protein
VRREYQRERQRLVLSGDGSTGRWDSMYLENVRRKEEEERRFRAFKYFLRLNFLFHCKLQLGSLWY